MGQLPPAARASNINCFHILSDPYSYPQLPCRKEVLAVSNTDTILEQLMAVIADRKANPPEKSYTTKLFNGGVPKIGEKIMEEAAEVVEAAGEEGDEGRAHLIYEAADLIYHLFVMLGHCDIRLEEVEAELARRFGISGIDEKASRNPSK